MPSVCIMCGTAISQPVTGRRRRFCSDAHRLHHHRSKPPARCNEIDYTQRDEIIRQYNDARLRFMHRQDHKKIGQRQRNAIDSLRGSMSNATNLNIDARNERPLAIDLFCGGGGAAAGLYMAGFDVVGIDIAPRPEYPFPFIMADATKLSVDSLRCAAASLVWASPPCQQYSTTNNYLKKSYPELVGSTRVLLHRAGVKHIMENVPGAPFIDPVALTGDMFGLGIIRRRHFESNLNLQVPLHRPERGRVISGECVTVAGACGKTELKKWKNAMGINFLAAETLAQAVPPAYSWYLSKQFFNEKDGKANP